MIKLGDISTVRVHTVTPSQSLDTAICQMEEYLIHHLPVVDNGAVVGMVSDRDILIAVGWMLEIERTTDDSGNEIVGPRRVKEVMSTPAICLDVDDSVPAAAGIMARRKIHAIPLLKKGKLAGIVTRLDILRSCIENESLAQACGFLNDMTRRHMHAGVLAVGPRDTASSVARTMKEKHIRHMLVESGGMIIGTVSDRDLRRACGTESMLDSQAEASRKAFLDEFSIIEIMSHPVRTIDGNRPVREAFCSMIEARVGCLPVIEGERAIGIITDTDLLNLVAATV
mgnify:CR=1 FL=1